MRRLPYIAICLAFVSQWVCVALGGPRLAPPWAVVTLAAFCLGHDLATLSREIGEGRVARAALSTSVAFLWALVVLAAAGGW